MNNKLIKAYQIFRNRFNEEEAQAIIDCFGSLSLDRLATKDDLYVLKSEIGQVKSELKEDMHGLEQKIGSLRTEFKEDIHEVETRLIRWMVGIAFVIIGAVLGSAVMT